jgi:glycerol-3-phosphate dehydrogenase (NAD(P)+)
MARVTVFGAGAMGTAMAIHAARRGADAALWANPYDTRALEGIRADKRHPQLPAHVPESLPVYGPDELDRAAAGVEIAVLAANSAGQRSLAKLVLDSVAPAQIVVSVAKGLESDTFLRMSQVLGQELEGKTIVSIAGPCLAAELAQELPTAAVWASAREADARRAGEVFEDRHYQIDYTDDLIGTEYCTVIKNVAAIGMGLLDGLGMALTEAFKNAKAALFTKAMQEVAELVVALGGRADTALGLAGLGDCLVTGLGGRNRIYGELVGAGREPKVTLEDMQRRGLTVEGVDSAVDVHQLMQEHGLDLPYHTAVYRVIVENADPRSLLEVLC